MEEVPVSLHQNSGIFETRSSRKRYFINWANEKMKRIKYPLAVLLKWCSRALNVAFSPSVSAPNELMNRKKSSGKKDDWREMKTINYSLHTNTPAKWKPVAICWRDMVWIQENIVKKNLLQEHNLYILCLFGQTLRRTELSGAIAEATTLIGTQAVLATMCYKTLT